MVALHAFLALAAGLAVVVLLGVGLAFLIGRLVPSWAGEEQGAKGTIANKRSARSLEPGDTFVRLGSSLLSGAAGGYVTAWVADANPLAHVLALGIAVLALAALSALQSKGRSPVWYQLAQVVISPLGVMAGGLLRLRVLDLL